MSWAYRRPAIYPLRSNYRPLNRPVECAHGLVRPARMRRHRTCVVSHFQNFTQLLSEITPLEWISGWCTSLLKHNRCSTDWLRPMSREWAWPDPRGWSESSRGFADVDKYVRIKRGVGDVNHPILETVEAVKLEPSCPRVQQFRPVSIQSYSPNI